MKFAFVILHYGPTEVTMSAVRSVLSLKKEGREISIVVVDNASPNGTGNAVKKELDPLPNTYFLFSSENVGFARGNNIGFQYAKNNLEADFIILMNNDAVIESKKFCKLVDDDYRQEKFAVLGPYIHTPNGKCQNPLRKKLLKGFRLKLTRVYLWLDLMLTWLCVVPFLMRFFAGRDKKRLDADESPLNDVELHGSFLIFSPLYIQKFDGLDDRTFMYCEEEFLFARCVASGLKSRYNPTIKVFHNEMESSCASICALRRKNLFRIKNCLKSLRIYSESF